MKITWYGKGCFLFNANNANVLLEPFDDNIAENIDFITSSQGAEYNYGLSFDWPGEYEAKGIGVEGLPIKNTNGEEIVVFILSLGKTRLCHLGKLDRMLDDSEISLLGNIDILFVPVGGNTVINAKTAHKITESIDPRMIIPMYFNDENDDEFLPLDDYKKEMGINNEQEVLDMLDIKTLPEEETKIILLDKK